MDEDKVIGQKGRSHVVSDMIRNEFMTNTPNLAMAFKIFLLDIRKRTSHCQCQFYDYYLMVYKG
jgi:hypothetical protein